MKYPITKEALNKAKKYAERAGEYTHLHDGFKNTTPDQQYKRWVTGGVAQNMVMDFCKTNNISCISDSTSHKENDLFDLEIQGFRFDIKATNTNIQCQVNNTSIKKSGNGRTHCFFFARVDKNMQWYEPLGFCTSKYYSDNCDTIKKGELIPNTSFINNFNTTYVMDENKIQYKGIGVLKELKYREFDI